MASVQSSRTAGWLSYRISDVVGALLAVLGMGLLLYYWWS